MSVAARMTAGAIVLMALASLSGAASAQQSEDWARCVNKQRRSLDLQVGGCTAVIQSGKESNKRLAIAFSNRGEAYRSKNQLDLAIQDFNEAIKLNPGFAQPFPIAAPGAPIAGRNDGAGELADPRVGLQRATCPIQ